MTWNESYSSTTSSTCEEVATYAQTVTILKNNGVNKSQLSSYLTPHPNLEQLVFEIYDVNFKDSKTVYSAIYSNCIIIGYTNLVQKLTDDEQARIYQEQKNAESKNSIVVHFKDSIILKMTDTLN
jgi:hypothetical protein